MIRSSCCGAALLLVLGAPALAGAVEQPDARAEAIPTERQPAAQPPAPNQERTVPAGQWAFTSQYGWTWMPYAQTYVSYPSPGAVPLMFVYTPATGWAWLAAPWVFGTGPRPYFTVFVNRWPFAWGWRYALAWHPGWRPLLPFHPRHH